MDYLGMFLFTAGALPILMGIVWASVYSSTDAHVVAPLVIGCVMLVVFALYETYADIKHPITPTSIFTSSKGRDFSAPCLALAILNMFYYSASIVWPTMINSWYTTDWRTAAVLSLPQNVAVMGGGILLSIFGSKIKNWQWQLTGAVTVLVVFGSLLALATPDNKNLMIAFMVLSMLGLGYGNYLCIAICQMGVPQEQLGTSGGLAGTARFGGGASMCLSCPSVSLFAKNNIFQSPKQSILPSSPLQPQRPPPSLSLLQRSKPVFNLETYQA
jgi:hypothetical protein